MGSCLSKKKDSSSSSVAAATSVPLPVLAPPPVLASVKSRTATVDPKKCDNGDTQKVLVTKQEAREEVKEEEGLVKKEIFVIKHRKSHDKRAIPNEEIVGNVAVIENEKEKEKEDVGTNICNGVVRTSSCTKEEVDAILIQCGRLSRSNSSAKAASSARKYSGSKRSYDFDQNDGGFERDGGDDGDSGDVTRKKGSDDDEKNQQQHRQRHRQSSRQSPGSRRRTPSRERDQQQSQQRSGSRERGSSGSSGRRVSRSPGRRSENNSATTANANANSNANSNSTRPGKMVSVPATVAVEPATAANSTGAKRISVKRNVGEVSGAVGSRTAASPRSKSPARVNGNNMKDQQQQQPSLSRSSSRKAEHSPYKRNPSGEMDPNSTRKTEHSPYRRNPLSEIDPNSLQYPQSACNNKASNVNCNRVRNKSRDFEGEGVLVNDSSANVLHQAPNLKPNAEIGAHGTNCKASSRGTLNNKVAGANIIEKEHQQILEEVGVQQPIIGNAVVTSVTEGQKPQALTRTRSSRRSRDLDIDPLLNPPPSYTALLLEDIQNFHQKSTPSVPLPACVTKACSILEAVADLNSTTSSNMSCAFSEDRKTQSADQSNRNAYNFSAGVNLVGKKMTEAKDPIVESEVFANDDLMEPSFHRYVTVRRGGNALEGADMDGQESSGSNSFVGSTQQNWNLSSSSWEPNSADSTDRWTSRSNTKEEEDQSQLGFQRRALSEAAGSDATKARKGFSGKRRDTDNQQNGNWRGRVAAST